MRARLGDEDADALRREHDRRLRDVLAAHGARGVKAFGDGLQATVDAAGAAVACAVEMQRAIDRQARRGHGALELRVGIAAGDVSWEGEDYFGAPVTEAQRLCAAAAPGGILVAEAVRLLAGGGTDGCSTTRASSTLRGLVQPVRAWAVPWAAQRTVVVPLAAPLVVDDSPPSPDASRSSPRCGRRGPTP